METNSANNPPKITVSLQDYFLPGPPLQGVVLGVGPLLAAPTAASRNTGAGKWQAGAAGVAVAPPWGLLAGLVTYQHSFAGDDSCPTAQIITAQPIVT